MTSKPCRSSAIPILLVVSFIFLIVSPVIAESDVRPAADTVGKSAEKPAEPRVKKPPVTRTVDTQLSGYMSRYADQLYARVSIQENTDGREWYTRGTYVRTATKTGSKSSYVGMLKLDARTEQAVGAKGYNVLTAALSRRDRTAWRRSGYHFISYGAGRRVSARVKSDIGAGVLAVYDEDDGTKPAVVSSIRGKEPLSEKLTLEGDILTIQPMDRLRSTKVDSEIGLSYKLAEGLYLRLSWAANNLLRPVRGDYEWDSVVRLIVSFRRTTER